MEPFYRKKGKNSIQITDLKSVFNNTIFKSVDTFLRTYEDIEWDAKQKKIVDSFRIFIIMDTDDCSPQQKKEYMNKEMFKQHWAYKYIIPINNSPELESVLDEINIPFTKKVSKRKNEYIKIFPTDPKYKEQNSDSIQLEDFMEKLLKCKNTNLNMFIKFCLDVSKVNNKDTRKEG